MIPHSHNKDSSFTRHGNFTCSPTYSTTFRWSGALDYVKTFSTSLISPHLYIFCSSAVKLYNVKNNTLFSYYRSCAYELLKQKNFHWVVRTQSGWFSALGALQQNRLVKEQIQWSSEDHRKRVFFVTPLDPTSQYTIKGVPVASPTVEKRPQWV